MSAKERFLQRLQQQRPRSGNFDTKSQADIAAFRLHMGQLHKEMEGWLADTGIRLTGHSVSLIELLAGGTTFSIQGVTLSYKNRVMTFTPAFLYGQSVVGCVDVSLRAEGHQRQLYRLYMRAGEDVSWTYVTAGEQPDSRRRFGEDDFFNMIVQLLPEE